MLVDDDARVGDVVQPVLRIALEAAAQQAPARPPAVSAGSVVGIDVARQHRGERVGDRLAVEELRPVSIS